MPEAWVDPEIFMSYRGVDIYHVYKNDHVSDGVRSYWYGTECSASDDNEFDPENNPVFDVRELPSYRLDMPHEDIIKAAIDGDEFKGWEGVPDPLPEPTEEDLDEVKPSTYIDAVRAELDAREYDAEDFDFSDAEVNDQGDGAVVTFSKYIRKEDL